VALKAVLFDLDGTLVNTIPDLTWGVNTMLALYGKGPLGQDAIRPMVGRGVVNLITRACEASALMLNEEQLRQAIERYCDIMVQGKSSRSTVFPDVFDALDRLRQASIRIAIVTNKPRGMTESALAQLDLVKRVDCVVAAGDAPSVKPAPEMLWLACEKLDVQRTEAVMVGDSCNDAIAARNAGLPAYLVATGYNEGVPIERWARENGFSKPLPSISAVLDALLESGRDARESDEMSPKATCR